MTLESAGLFPLPLNTTVDINNLAAVVQWAQAENITHRLECNELGDCLVLNEKVVLQPNPKGNSSEHLRKVQAQYQAKNQQLYYVYFWETNSHRLLSHFKSKLGLDTRKYAAKRLVCEVIGNKEADAFMKNHHIQGMARGTDKVSLALLEKNTREILAVQQYAKYRFGVSKAIKLNESKVWEGLRLCFKENVQIHGGASRLQKQFEKIYSPEKIIGYISLSHSDGQYKAFQGFSDVTDWHQLSYMWVLEGKPNVVPIIDKNGVQRVNDLNEALKKPVVNPNQMAGVWGKGVGQLFYGGKLGSRKQLREHEENGDLVHNDVILEAIGYKKHYTAGQAKWEKILKTDEI